MKNIRKVKTYSIRKRHSKVDAADFAVSLKRKAAFRDFYHSLPNILKVKDIRALVSAVVAARKKRKSVIFMCGAHVIKCGLSPLLIELIKRKVITCVCLNGAGIIHDFEIAFQAKTSEDVAGSLKDGSFGMGRETAEFINKAVVDGVGKGLGLGESVAKKINSVKLPFRRLSLLSNAYSEKVPVCVFAAIGTDIIHQHPSFDAASTGEGSLKDFHTLVGSIAGLDGGGVVINFGSAVILPEVFLKALNLARNIGNKVRDFTTANFDMIAQYRPSQNVVCRPVMAGGKGYSITGHHEIMLPLLAQAIIEQI